jgi:hypothetical protein
MTDISTSLQGLPLEALAPATTNAAAGRIARTALGLVRRRAYGAAALLLARAALSPVATTGWLKALEGLSSATGLAALPCDLIDKAHHPLPDPSFGPAARIRLLSHHYRLLLAALGPEAVARLLRGQHLPVAALTGVSGQVYRLNLCRDLRARSPGELVVSLSRAARAEPWLASLTLTAGELELGGGASLWIGALHAASPHDAGGGAMEATHDLWGLSPREVVLECAYALASLLGAQGLKGWPAHGRGLNRATATFDLPTVRFREDPAQASDGERRTLREREALIDAITAATHALSALRTRPVCQLVDLRWYRLPANGRPPERDAAVR